MTHYALRAISMLLVVLATVACGGGAQGASPQPKAATFDEFGTAYCAAWDELFTAIGNPDTGSVSALRAEFEKAVTAGDTVSAERLAATITGRLEAGRAHVAVASGWQSAGPMLAQLDRVFLAFEAMVAAKRAEVTNDPGALTAQAAFEKAGGVEAWRAMFEAGRTMQRPANAGDRRCPTVPLGY